MPGEASSSDAPPAPPDGPPGKAAVTVGTINLRGLDRVPHEGRLWLDRVGAKHYVLTDMLTQEVRSLLAGKWRLEFATVEKRGVCLQVSDDGTVDGELSEDDDSRSIIVDDFMKYNLATKDGNIIMFWQAHGPYGRLESAVFTDLVCRYEIGSAKVRIGHGDAWTRIDVSAMQRERDHGARLFWSLISMYRSLGLSTYKGIASDWVTASKDSWKKFASLTFPGTSILLSKHGNISDKTKDAIKWHDRCLPWVSMGTPCLLQQLARWAYNMPDAGGFRKAQDDSAKIALSILDSWVREGCTTTEREDMSIALQDSWQDKWPRLAVIYESHVVVSSLGLLPGLAFDISLLFSPALDPCARFIQTRWRSEFSKAIDASDRFDVLKYNMPILKFFRVVASQQGLAPLFGQVTAWIARRLEAKLFANADDDDFDGKHVHLSIQSGSKLEACDPIMDERLFVYREESRKVTALWLNISLAHDKASPGVQSLQNAIFVLPNSVGIVATPQVAGGPELGRDASRGRIRRRAQAPEGVTRASGRHPSRFVRKLVVVVGGIFGVSTGEIIPTTTSLVIVGGHSLGQAFFGPWPSRVFTRPASHLIPGVPVLAGVRKPTSIIWTSTWSGRRRDLKPESPSRRPRAGPISVRASSLGLTEARKR